MPRRMLTQDDLTPFSRLSGNEKMIACFAISRFERKDVKAEEESYFSHPQYGLCWATYHPETKMVHITPLEHPIECACCGQKTNPVKLQ